MTRVCRFLEVLSCKMSTLFSFITESFHELLAESRRKRQAILLHRQVILMLVAFATDRKSNDIGNGQAAARQP